MCAGFSQKGWICICTVHIPSIALSREGFSRHKGRDWSQRRQEAAVQAVDTPVRVFHGLCIPHHRKVAFYYPQFIVLWATSPSKQALVWLPTDCLYELIKVPCPGTGRWLSWYSACLQSMGTHELSPRAHTHVWAHSECLQNQHWEETGRQIPRWPATFTTWWIPSQLADNTQGMAPK